MSDFSQFAPVGAVVHCGYWGTRYRVLAHVTHDDWRGESVRVETLDGPQAGRVHEHGTPFDPKRDRILYENDRARVADEAVQLLRGMGADVVCTGYADLSVHGPRVIS